MNRNHLINVYESSNIKMSTKSCTGYVQQKRGIPWNKNFMMKIKI